MVPERAWVAGFMVAAAGAGINKIKSLGGPPSRDLKLFSSQSYALTRELIDRKPGFSVKNVQVRKIHRQNYFIALIHDPPAFAYGQKF